MNFIGAPELPLQVEKKLHTYFMEIVCTGIFLLSSDFFYKCFSLTNTESVWVIIYKAAVKDNMPNFLLTFLLSINNVVCKKNDFLTKSIQLPGKTDMIHNYLDISVTCLFKYTAVPQTDWLFPQHL